MAVDADIAIGHGTTIGRSTDGGTTFTDLANVTAFSPPSPSAETVDVTNMDSPNKTREFIRGLMDEGEASFTVSLTKAGETIIEAMKVATAAEDYKITLPDGSDYSFKAFATGIERSTPLDSDMETSVTLKIASAVTFTSAA